VPNRDAERLSTRIGALQTVRLQDDEGQELSCEVEVGEAARLLTFSLAKPMGLYLAEKANGDVVVDEIVLGGNASGSGIEIGDVVTAVTARSQEDLQPGKRTRENLYSSRTKDNLFGRLFLFRAQGESFDTVMAAIASNKCSQCQIQLVVKRNGSSN